MLGFNDMDEAKSDYLANYEKGWEDGRRIVVSTTNLEDFEKWIDSSHRKTKPFSEYAGVKKETVANAPAKGDTAVPNNNKPRLQKAGVAAAPVSKNERVLRGAVDDHLRNSGMEVIGTDEGQRVLDMANGKDVRMSAKKRRALETASLGNNPRSLTVVSSANGAKVLNNVDKLANDFDNSPTQPKTFIGDVAKALGATRNGSRSEYATFETRNGNVVTIRLSDHNAKVSNFDNNGETEGISIVVSPKENEGAINDGDAHVVEYFYNAIKLRRAEGKPLADIVRSIKQALYSGEFKDTTGLAERQEVNADEAVRLQKVYHGSGAYFDHFDHSHMGEGEGAQAYGWGTYVTEVEGIGRTYAEKNARFNGLKDASDIEERLLEKPILRIMTCLVLPLLLLLTVQSS